MNVPETFLISTLHKTKDKSLIDRITGVFGGDKTEETPPAEVAPGDQEHKPNLTSFSSSSPYTVPVASFWQLTDLYIHGLVGCCESKRPQTSEIRRTSPMRRTQSSPNLLLRINLSCARSDVCVCVCVLWGSPLLITWCRGRLAKRKGSCIYASSCSCEDDG